MEVGQGNIISMTSPYFVLGYNNYIPKKHPFMSNHLVLVILN